MVLFTFEKMAEISGAFDAFVGDLQAMVFSFGYWRVMVTQAHSSGRLIESDLTHPDWLAGDREADGLPCWGEWFYRFGGSIWELPGGEARFFDSGSGLFMRWVREPEPMQVLPLQW